jgi:hypothetical protein
MWVGLRWTFIKVIRSWSQLRLDTANSEMQDVWADTRRSQWQARREFVEAQREAYREVALPLEPCVPATQPAGAERCVGRV